MYFLNIYITILLLTIDNVNCMRYILIKLLTNIFSFMNFIENTGYQTTIIWPCSIQSPSCSSYWTTSHLLGPACPVPVVD